MPRALPRSTVSPPPRHGSLAGRALANTLLALASCAASCSDRGAAPGAAQAPAQATLAPAGRAPSPVDARVDELVLALTPIDDTVTSDLQDAHFVRGQALLAELRAADREVGVAALARLRDVRAGQAEAKRERILAIERGLLDVAAHAAPEDTRELLRSLVTTYGPALDLRTDALGFYADVHPEEALAVIEPVLARTRSEETGPPAEFYVRAYVVACAKTGRSPVAILSRVATNLFMEEAARVAAVKELRHHQELLASQTLQQILVESTGDGYLRRMAAQGIRDSLPRETACEIFLRVGDKEADLNFLAFLRDVIEKNCPQ